MAEVSNSSAAHSRPNWAAFAIPSIPDVVFVALLGALLFTPIAVRLLGDAGIGWHIRTGQLILSTHQVPHVDPFSTTMSGKPWYAWEWLYDVIVGQCDASLGLNGVVWFNAVIIATVFSLALNCLLSRGASLCAAIGMLLLALSSAMIHFLARPHVLSWLFAVLFFAILDGTERDSVGAIGGQPTKRLWLLPLLMAAWVNVHGGFLIGLALIGIFWLDAAVGWFRCRADRIEESFAKIVAARRARALAWVGLLSVLATLLNPYGWRLHEHIYSYLSSRFLMSHIQEFQSPDFHGIAPRCFLLLLLVALAALSLWGRALRTSGILIAIFAVYTGLYSARNIPTSALLLIMTIVPIIPKGSTAGFLGRMAAMQTGLRGHLWPIAAVLLTVFAAAHHGVDAHFDPKRMPVAAVDHMTATAGHEPVFTPDSWGGYLIYRFYPQARVVADDRHDLYGEAFFKSYLKTVRVEPGWQDFLRDHNVSCVLFPRDAALTNILLETPGWKSVYEDDVAVILERNASPERSAKGCN